jgi:hypothetical protein
MVGKRLLAGLACWITLVVVSEAGAQPPPQRLPSAILVYPLVVVEGGGLVRDTRIEIVNLTGREQSLSCFYVDEYCNEIGFFVTLTANQPLSWLASKGLFGGVPFASVPPVFYPSAELKCSVIPREPTADAYNAIQGRAIVVGADGQTAGIAAVGFRRLADGAYTRVAHLDGETYDQCPRQLDFVFLAVPDGPPNPLRESEIVLAPCTEDLENQRPMSTVVQLRVWNEFEESLSGSFTVTCLSRRLLRDASPIFRLSQLGTPGGHLSVRAAQIPVIGLIIDRFTDGALSTSANEPFLQGGSPAKLTFP